MSRVRALSVIRLRRVFASRRARLIGGAVLLLPFLVLAVVAYHVFFDESDVPDIQRLVRFELPTTGQVYDAQGTVLVSMAHEYRQTVGYNEIPVIVRDAILSAEDKNFFSHSGVDFSVVPRVAIRTASRSISAWFGGDGVQLRLPQGGSTITQQLVRGFYLEDQARREDDSTQFHRGVTSFLLSHTLSVPIANKLLRKLEEVRLALWVERAMTRHYGSHAAAKREIFARYANLIYLGHGRYGFAAASLYYFGKPLTSYTDDDADKAAMLAGISKSPRKYAPTAASAQPLRRRNDILALMAGNGYISDSLAARSSRKPIVVSLASDAKPRAAGAIAGVLAELRQVGGKQFAREDIFNGKIVVQTTLDERVQAVVNDALEHGLAAYEARHPSARGIIQGAVVVLRNSDASILAEAGGRQTYQARRADYSDYNRATDAMRQPGSAWKPFVYLAAFRHGLDLDTVVPDEPTEVSDGNNGEVKWIDNYDGLFKGPLPVREALAESRNTVAVWLARSVGIDKVIATAHAMGIRSPIHGYISTALGASEVRLLELTNAYRAIASGVAAEPHVIARVTNVAGSVLYRHSASEGWIDTTGLSLIQEGLRGVVRIPGGTAQALDRKDFGIPVMGKTGTTNDFRDALFAGSTYGMDGITVAVRIGFDDARTLGSGETGGRTALPVFREIMARVYANRFEGVAPTFPGAIEAGIDAYISRGVRVGNGDGDAPFTRAALFPSRLPRVSAPWVITSNKNER